MDRSTRRSSNPEIEAYRSALRPFAAVADFLKDRAKSGDMIFRCVGPKQRTVEIPFSAFEQARLLLTPEPAGEATPPDQAANAEAPPA